MFSPDGKYVAATGNDGLVRIWEVNPTPPLPELNGHAATVRSVAFSPDGQFVLTGSDDHTARLWDVHTGQPLRAFTGHDNQIWSAVFSPDGKLLAVGLRPWGGEMHLESHPGEGTAVTLSAPLKAPPPGGTAL